MENYGPGDERIIVEEGQIQKSGLTKEAMELEISDSTNVVDSINLILSILGQSRLVLLKSNTNLGVQTQIVGEIRAKKKVYWIYSELLNCEIVQEWIPLSNVPIEHSPLRKRGSIQGNKSTKKRGNEDNFDLDILMVSRQSQQLVTLLSNSPIKLLKNLPTKNHILFPKKKNLKK
jgi:hypothetical protein